MHGNVMQNDAKLNTNHAAVAWIIGDPSRALSFQAPLLGYRVFLLRL